MYQKTTNHAAKRSTSSTIRMIGFIARLVEWPSAGDPRAVFASPCSSSAGVTRMLKTNNELSVTFSANPRAAGCRESEISHISKTTSTVERPMLVAKTREASFCDEGRASLLTLCAIPLLPPWLSLSLSLLYCGSASFVGLLCASPHSRGKRRCHASSAATSHVMMKGREDQSSVPGEALSRRRVRYEGAQASQSSSVGNMA